MNRIFPVFTFLIIVACVARTTSSAESNRIEIKRGDVTLQIFASKNQNAEISESLIYLNNVEVWDTLSVGLVVKGASENEYSLSGSGCTIEKTGATYLVKLSGQNSFNLSVGQKDQNGAVICLETFKFQIHPPVANGETIQADTTDCGFAFGLEKAINCAEVAEDISCYKEDWPPKTSSSLFFQRIANNQNLKEINFCFVDIDSLPASIGSVINLEVLQLSGGTITTIPKEIGNLKHLKKLIFGTSQDECGGNKITSIPVEISGCESLEFLGLAYSVITDLPDQLKYCKKLQTIDLYMNQGINLTKLQELKSRFPTIQFISHLE